MRKKSNLPKWRYDFDCRKCDNVKELNDEKKRRHGNYCVAFVERYDAGEKMPIHADDDRVVRCDCFTPIPEKKESGKKGKKKND